MKIEPTESQANLLDKVKVWFRNWENGMHIGPHPQWFSYSGAAGVGKGVAAKMIVDMLGLGKHGYIACAYVGKAVLQLSKNGMNAKTIHSLIYDARPVYEKRDDGSGATIVKYQFFLKDKLDGDYRLIFVDEAGMVNDSMRDELLSFGIPIIFIGDMNQLPPVFGTSTVLANPDHILTQIMRQKENDPIVQLSQMVLKDIPLLEGQYGRSEVVRDFELDRRLITDFDQILCNTNEYRVRLNEYIRKKIKKFPNHPVIGDKVVCCQNNWSLSVDDYPLTNGMIGSIADINRSRVHQGYYLIDFEPDFLESGRCFRNLKMDVRYINSSYDEQKNTGRLMNEKFEYGYAITVYKSQGSEFDRVLYFDSRFRTPELTKRSRYTAITRAKEALTIVLSKDSSYRY